MKMEHFKTGTSISFVMNMRNVSKYIIESLDDYKQLFLYDKEQKKIVEKMKDNEEKEFKKFVNNFTQPLIDEYTRIIRGYDGDVQTLGQILKIIHKDVKEIQEKLKGIKNINLMDNVKKIVDEGLRR